MTGENGCGCRLPCGICMITNRMCPIWYNTDTPLITYDNEGTSGLHVDLKDVKLMQEKIKAKIKE